MYNVVMSENKPNQEHSFGDEPDYERQEKDHRGVISKLGEFAIYTGSIAATAAIVIGVTDLLGEPLSIPVATAIASVPNSAMYLNRRRS
jgi:hypothetical protein